MSEVPKSQRAPQLDTEAEQWLRAVGGDAITFGVPLARRTTMRIGGPADAWFEPPDIESLVAMISLCDERGVPLTPLGGGSNLLVRDGGIRGVVLSTRALRTMERLGEQGVRAQAGVPTSGLLTAVTRWELGGLESLGGVPGSVGGALIMNAGTYLGEIGDAVREVVSVKLDSGEVIRRDHAACGFAYRQSTLPLDELVVEGLFELTARPSAEIEQDVRELRDRRAGREPKGVANAGSIFKNPPGDHAGRLIEASGCKGLRVGAAECSAVHANWLVNTGGATATDMLELIDQVRARVLADHGVSLELEIKIVGDAK